MSAFCPRLASAIRLALLSCVTTTALVIGSAGHAFGACEITPGPEGEISTWLVAGPVPVPQARPQRTVDSQLTMGLAGLPPRSLHPSLDAPLGGRTPARWSAAVAAETHLDLDSLGRGRDARMAFAALDLEVETLTALQLFLGADDGVAVFLDGNEVGRRAAIRDALDDDLRVPFDLVAGHHTLVIALYVNSGRMRLIARLVDRAFQPPTHLRITLPGIDDGACSVLGHNALRVTAQREVLAEATRVAIEARYPGGTARATSESTRTLELHRVGGPALARVEMQFGGSHAPDAALDATVPLATTALEALVAGDPTPVRTIDVTASGTVRRVLVAARALLAGLHEESPPAWLPRESLTSVAYVAQRLDELVRDGDGDTPHLESEAATLQALLDALVQQRDPYAMRHGAMRRGYRSVVDGTLQGYSIYVPATYRGDRDFPVVIALHGMNGSAHRMLAVLFGLYDEHEARPHADRYLPPLPDTRAILVAPYAFGDTGYRNAGETDVMQVLDEVRRAYRTDVDRTYITGLSMGGIGAASIPLHRPGIFAASAALCGYHSYFVRDDTQGVRQPWETFLMETRSNAVWAENALHLPFYVVHGTLDIPTANSRVLVDRLQALHYRVESEWPELGHDVWSSTYAGGRIVPYLAQFRRDAAPRRVRFRTANMRWRRNDWVEIDALERRDAWGDVSAAVLDGTNVEVTTHGVSALTLAPPRGLFGEAATEVVYHVDGDELRHAVGGAISMQRSASGHWEEHPRVVAAVMGPVRDVWDRATAVVYGTHDEHDTAMNLRVARAWARGGIGTHVHVPVVRDDDVTPEFAERHALVLIGTVASNGYLARIAARLPIRVDSGAVVAGEQRFAGEEVGAVFAVANPDVPTQPIVVVTGTSALGVWRSRFLPDLVPDYLVYDARIAPARGRVILGARASVLMGGFFDSDGRVHGTAASARRGRSLEMASARPSRALRARHRHQDHQHEFASAVARAPRHGASARTHRRAQFGRARGVHRRVTHVGDT